MLTYTSALNTTQVVNVQKTRKPYTYIGRAGKGKDGYFGNPFSIKSEKDRDSVIQQYKRYLWNRVNNDPEFRERLWALKGQTLGCFCKPHACHGDIIVSWIEAGGPYRVNGTVFKMEEM